MIILLFGPPGSGKGTQARLISEWLNFPSLSTGDMLRAEAQQDSELGRKIRETLAAGQYVSDETVNLIVLQQLERNPGSGLILDGYPRTVAQAIYLENALLERGFPPPVVVHLDVPAEEIVTRLSSRASCPRCKQILNLLQNPPKVEGRCDECSSELVRREDDKPEVVRSRLDTYARLTGPVIAHYTGSNYLLFDGNRKPGDVFAEIRAGLQPLFDRWFADR